MAALIDREKIRSAMQNQRLRTARQQVGLTQSELGFLIGRSEVAISKYETGRSRPSRENQTKLAEILGVDRCELF
jgi:transcriptional regulator with XRE-family HTH domain